jgi:phosphohistidine phosphatase
VPESTVEKYSKPFLELTLVRHGEAVDPEEKSGLVDFDRPLTERGRQQAQWIGGQISDQFDLIIVSDAVRTRETFSLMARLRSFSVKTHFEPQAYLAGRKTLQKVLLHHIESLGNHVPQKILFVGHNPGISHLLEHLSSCDHGLKTADGSILTINEMDWNVALEAEGLWNLERFLRNPK